MTYGLTSFNDETSNLDIDVSQLVNFGWGQALNPNGIERQHSTRGWARHFIQQHLSHMYDLPKKEVHITKLDVYPRIDGDDMNIVIDVTWHSCPLGVS